MRDMRVYGLAGLLTALTLAPAFAQPAPKIGDVASVRKDAARSGKQVSLGDAVFQNEVMTTGVDSSLRLTFVDQTNLAMGPTSRLRLDKFVYDALTQEMAVSLTRGAFRFSSGNLDKRAYRIETPTATMGVRGTIVNIAIAADGASTFTSFEGNATVCSRITGQCLEIGPGQSVQVTSSGAIARVNTQVTFTDYCAANPTLCGSLTQTAGGAPIAPSAGLTAAPSTGLILLGATGVGALTAGVIAISDNGSSNTRPLSP
jgi:hypothetical protein